MTVPSRGWYVEIDYPGPSADTLYTPTIVDPGPTLQPQPNDYPRVDIPVEKNSRWDSLVEKFPNTKIPLRFWKDGRRQPLEELVDVVTRADKTILKARGGSELSTFVERSVDQERIDTLVEDLITTNTSYSANVDRPPTTTQTNEQLLSLSTSADFQSRLSSSPSDPIDISGGTVSLLQSNWPQDINDREDEGGPGFGFDLSASGAFNTAQALLTDAGDFIEWTFTNDYRIRQRDFNWADRIETDGPDPPDVNMYVDGSVVGKYRDHADFGLVWRQGRTGDFDEHFPIELPPGKHTARIEAVAGGADFHRVDIISPHDYRYNYTFTDPPDEPETKPEAVELVFDDIPAPQAVTGGRAETTWSATNSNQEIALSNDQGATYGVSGTNTQTIEGDFTSPEFGPTLTFRATLSRGTQLQDVTLKADLESMPLAVNKSFSGSLMKILQTLADTGNFLFEVRADGGTLSVEWTRPGQRTSDADPDVSDFEFSRSKEDIVNKAIVFGQSQQRRGELFVP
jgi:hypothetical protein